MCPENPLQNVFSFLTEWFVLVPKNYDVVNKKWQSLLKPTLYTTKWHPPTPFFSTEWRLIRGSTPPILWRKWQGG